MAFLIIFVAFFIGFAGLWFLVKKPYSKREFQKYWICTLPAEIPNFINEDGSINLDNLTGPELISFELVDANDPRLEAALCIDKDYCLDLVIKNKSDQKTILASFSDHKFFARIIDTYFRDGFGIIDPSFFVKLSSSGDRVDVYGSYQADQYSTGYLWKSKFDKISERKTNGLIRLLLLPIAIPFLFPSFFDSWLLKGCVSKIKGFLLLFFSDKNVGEVVISSGIVKALESHKLFNMTIFLCGFVPMILGFLVLIRLLSFIENRSAIRVFEKVGQTREKNFICKRRNEIVQICFANDAFVNNKQSVFRICVNAGLVFLSTLLVKPLAILLLMIGGTVFEYIEHIRLGAQYFCLAEKVALAKEFVKKYNLEKYGQRFLAEYQKNLEKASRIEK